MASHKGQARKRCDRCGWAGLVPAGRQHCRQRRFGVGSYACWGQLRLVVRKRSEPPVAVKPAGVGIGWYLSEEAMAETERLRDPRVRFRKELAKAQGKVTEWIDAVARDTDTLRKWQRRAERYAKLAVLTDAEVKARSEKARQALANRKTRRRGIRLEGEL